MVFKHRKKNRKQGFDYSTEHIYFVTICTDDRYHKFGHIENECMILNDFGEIAERQLEWLQERYSYLFIHNMVVMPNHVHILLEIDSRNCSDKIKSVSELIGAYKTTTSKLIHLFGNFAFKWQRSFHDHIVRDATAYTNIFNYISQNPKRWQIDVHNDALGSDRS